MIQNVQESHLIIPATLADIEPDAPSALQWMGSETDHRVLTSIVTSDTSPGFFDAIMRHFTGYDVTGKKLKVTFHRVL